MIPDYLDKMYLEANELQIKKDKLDDYIKHQSVTVDPIQLNLMLSQLASMKTYLRILRVRIDYERKLLKLD